MSLSNSQYNEIMRGYQKQQIQDKYEQDSRREEAFVRIPRLEELERSISANAVSCARRLLAGEKSALEELRRGNRELREEKARLLASHGYPEDYLELKYQCPDCRDTGYQDGRKCHCFRQAEHRLLYAQSNIETVVERENFSTLSMEYYEKGQAIPELGISVFEYMERVVGLCRRFAERFDEDGGNLLFTGGTGVGKTFLTNCIAKDLMDRYHSVIYLSSHDLFEVFSRNKFEYKTDEDMRGMYQHILDCDLLIIDDLGTELNNSFTSSQLFYCINERLGLRKSTVISTNLSMNMLRDTYTDRVTSRIMSHYTTIPLYGGDIRLKKRRRPARPD